MTKPAPLTGLRIVSMAEQYPGPYAGMILSDLGAEVVRIERPQGGDPSRFAPGFFEALNRGQKSVALDVKTEAGRAQALELIAQADAFLDGFRPGKLEALGLGAAALRQANPRLVHVAISAYGQDGPYRNRPGHDLSVQALVGGLDPRGASGAPSAPGFYLADLSAGLFAVIAVLSGVLARQRDGEGVFADVAMSDCLAALMATPLAIAANAERFEDGPQAEPGYGVFECADGQAIALSIAHEDAYWAKLCRRVGLTQAASLSRSERLAQAEALKAQLADKLRMRPRAAWEADFAADQQLFSPVNPLHKVCDDPHIAARGVFEKIPNTDRWAVRQPVRFDRCALAPLCPAPALGDTAPEAAFHGPVAFLELEP
ncbi:MAG: CaiB/BaiF CoA transferase family protein [Maricaulaceae bacterium]